MVRWPGRRSRAEAPPALPHGWPDWLPVEGGGRPRDIVPTHRFWDVARLFHDDPARDDGWPDPVRPGAEQRSLCDVLGHSVEPVPTMTAAQARTLLATLDGDAPLHALRAGDDDAVRADAATHGWPVVDGRHVQPELAGRAVALVADLDRGRAVDLLADGHLSHLWSDTWLLRCDPWGPSSSTLVAGVHGTAERLRRSGLAVLPIGHAYAWPPPCTTCDTTPA